MALAAPRALALRCGVGIVRFEHGQMIDKAQAHANKARVARPACICIACIFVSAVMDFTCEISCVCCEFGTRSFLMCEVGVSSAISV